MIVELAGLPGSGKSTIRRELRRGNSSLHSVVVRPAYGKLLWRHSGGLGAREVLRPGPAWPAWLSLCARHAAQVALNPGGQGTLLLEEGVTHHIWRSRFLHPELERRPWRALLNVATPLVVLVAPQLVRHERIRGKARRGPVNEQLAMAAPGDVTWQRAEQLMEEVLAAARQLRKVVTVNTEGDLGDAVGRVLAMVAAGG